MTRKEAEKHKDVIIAYLEGKKIQIFDKTYKEWHNIDIPSWLEEYTYRIKPEEPQKKIVPFTFEDAEQLKGKWVMRRGYDNYKMITGITDKTVLVGTAWISFCILLSDYFFESGEPCGKEVIV